MTEINIQTEDFSFGLRTSIKSPDEIKARIIKVLDSVLGTGAIYTLAIGSPISQDKIKCIKAIRTVTNLGLKEAKDIYDTTCNTSKAVTLPILIEDKNRDAVALHLSPCFSVINWTQR